MMINIIKFFHLLFTLSLMGFTSFCFLSFAKKKERRIQHFQHINKLILFISVGAILTGTLLVYPKNFNFHTPWIQAAYLIMFLFCIVISLLILFPQKKLNHWVLKSIYLALILALIAVIHDAVTKSTFISF